MKHVVTDITSFGKRLGSSLGHTLNFCPNLVQYRFRIMFHKESFTLSSTVILSTNFGGSKAKRISSRRARIQWNAFDVVSMTQRSSRGLYVLCSALLQPLVQIIPKALHSNKAVGTIWRALSKPPQRGQGSDLRPLWLLVGTPSAFGPELAYRLCVAQPTLMDVTRYIWYTFILLYMFVYHIFMTSPLWLDVGPEST